MEELVKPVVTKMAKWFLIGSVTNIRVSNSWQRVLPGVEAREIQKKQLQQVTSNSKQLPVGPFAWSKAEFQAVFELESVIELTTPFTLSLCFTPNCPAPSVAGTF